MGYWDGITFASLIFTAVVTPVEVAFSGTQPLRFGKDYHELPLFILNRIVDAVFISDFFMQFFMGYQDDNKIVRDKVSTAVAALEGRARDESRKRDAETDALHAKLDRLLAALDAKG